nr:hypothetical protein [Tanacetum cinerariifolium]
MQRGFLDSGGRDGIHKEKEDRCSKPRLIDEGVFVNAIGYTTMNANIISPSVIDEPVVKEKQSSLVDTCIPREVVSPSVVDETVAKEKQSPLVNTTGLGSGKKVNFQTFYTPWGNEIDVVVLVDSIRAISERFVNTAYGVFLGKRLAYPVVANYVRNTLVDKIEKLIINGKVTLVDDKGKALEKSLLEQWTESFENADYGYDPYDDDMYEGQDIPNKLQDIFDKLDITVRGHRKK